MRRGSCWWRRSRTRKCRRAAAHTCPKTKHDYFPVIVDRRSRASGGLLYDYLRNPAERCGRFCPHIFGMRRSNPLARWMRSCDRPRMSHRRSAFSQARSSAARSSCCSSSASTQVRTLTQPSRRINTLGGCRFPKNITSFVPRLTALHNMNHD